MTDAVKLKPCPFCGGEPEVRGVTMTEVFCTNDQCISTGAYNNYGHRVDAISAWNTRAEPAPAPDAVQIEPVGYVSKQIMGWLEKKEGVLATIMPNKGEFFCSPLYDLSALASIKEMEEALKLMMKEFREADLPYGSEAYGKALDAVSKSPHQAMDRIKELEAAIVAKDNIIQEDGITIAELMDKFEALTKDRDEWELKAKTRLAELSDLKAWKAEAMRVMEPFANTADHDIGDDEADTDTFTPMTNHNSAMKITVGHMRAISRALTGGQKDG